MMLWFLLSAMLTRPAALLVPHLELLGIVEKVVFAAMTVLLLLLCVLRKKPLRLDWFPLAGTMLAAAIRVGWYGYFRWATADLGENAYEAVLRLNVISNWKDFILQIILCAVAVWHIYWMSRPRFIK